MKLNFHHLALLNAVLFFILAIVWMFAPARSLGMWGVEFNSSAGLVSRRSAALYAGFAVMFFSARNAEPSPVRKALVRGIVVSCFILALLGILEMSAGRANRGILPAVCIEIAFGLAFLFVDHTHAPQGNDIIK